MEIYELIVDNRVEIWKRDHVTVEAENLTEAINRAKSGKYDYVDDTEYLGNTEIYLKSEEGFMTCEIMDASGKTVWSDENRQFRSNT